MIYRFGEFELDDGLYQLRRGSDLLKLEPKAFDVLLYLVRNRDHVVSKRELLDNLWSGDFVTESVLPRAITAIRKALEDERDEAKYVQTVHGRGYHFVANVHDEGSTSPPPASGLGRRLTALLSADAVGYSRLMAEDETATIRTLTSHMEVIRIAVGQHHGRVVDAPGDNVLAEFPTALDAVRCAVEIQGTLSARNRALAENRRMPFRIGIHLGDVAVENEQLYGDGVNIAARLEGLAEHGGIAISGTVYEQVRNKLGLACEDQGQQQVKNIPDPVHIYRVLIGTAGPSKAAHSHLWLRRTLAGVATVVLLVALGLWFSWPRPLGWLIDWAGVGNLPVNPSLPDNPSLVVLPFDNLSGDPERDYFADAVTEELTNALAVSPELFVISRNSAFSYRGKSVPVDQIGRELGVRYVMEGSIRLDENRMRVVAQLIEASTGFHLWSQSYDRDLEDIFALQAEIAQEIATTLRYPLLDAEIERIGRKPTQNLSAYDALLRSYYHIEKTTRADNRKARELAERAIELDRDFAEAWAMLSTTYAAEFILGWNRDPEIREKAETFARKAIQLDEFQPSAYIALSTIHLDRDEFKEALENADRAIELAPYIDGAYSMRAAALAGLGRPLEAVTTVQQALRINPKSPSWMVMTMAYVNFKANRIDEAMELLERVRATNSDLILPRLPLVTAYDFLGKHEDARQVAQEIQRINPELEAEEALAMLPEGVSDSEESRSALLRYLREAGLR